MVALGTDRIKPGGAGPSWSASLLLRRLMPPITLPLVEQLKFSTLTVKGHVKGGDWHVFDDSQFTNNVAGKTIEGGEWEVEHRARALAGRDIPCWEMG